MADHTKAHNKIMSKTLECHNELLRQLIGAQNHPNLVAANVGLDEASNFVNEADALVSSSHVSNDSQTLVIDQDQVIVSVNKNNLPNLTPKSTVQPLRASLSVPTDDSEPPVTFRINHKIIMLYIK